MPLDKAFYASKMVFLARDRWSRTKFWGPAALQLSGNNYWYVLFAGDDRRTAAAIAWPCTSWCPAAPQKALAICY